MDFANSFVAKGLCRNIDENKRSKNVIWGVLITTFCTLHELLTSHVANNALDGRASLRMKWSVKAAISTN